MSLYVRNSAKEMTLNRPTRYRKATPGEALQYALTCRTCEGSGEYRGEIPFMPDDDRCPDCVSGIPRWAIETVAEQIAKRLGGTDAAWPRPNDFATEVYRNDAVAVLKSLRDRKETE